MAARRSTLILKSSCAGLTTLTTAIWIWSAWFGADWVISPHLRILVVRGLVIVETAPIVPDTGLIWFTLPHADIRLWYEHWNFRVQIPIWWALVLTGLPTMHLFFDVRAWRRRCAGLCESCAYDLSGLPSSTPCPECGKVQARPSRRPAPKSLPLNPLTETVATIPRPEQ